MNRLTEFIKKHRWKMVNLLVLISLLVGSYSAYENKQATFATPEQLMSPYLRGMNIHLSDLAIDNVIRGKTIEDCDLYGPALLKLNNLVSIRDAQFDGSFDAILVTTTNDYVIGNIVIASDVNIRNCRFYNIGIIDSEANIEAFKQYAGINQ